MWNPGAVDGFECVFQSKRELEKFVTHPTGKRSDMPLYFQLWQDESINHVWIACISKEQAWFPYEEDYVAKPMGLIVRPNFRFVDVDF